MDETLRIALVGTGQAGTATGENDVPAPISAMTAQLAPASRERALLLRAGATAIYRRAGRLAAPAPQRPAAAASESLRTCGPALAALIAALLEGTHASVLPEALALLAARRRRLPVELLPLALDVLDADLRRLLLPLVGERGRWLAQLEPSWRWAALARVDDALPADADTRWEEGSHDERLGLLALARRVDAPRARRWLAGTWAQEKADHRGALLDTLAIGLAGADEPFLDAALADRSAAVRLAAARLLWRLPASALAQRMAARADVLLRSFTVPRAGLLGRMKAAFASDAAEGKPGTLDVILPFDTFDPAWARDGIVEAPPQGTGRRQWWLAQLVSALPPSRWSERLGASPAQLVASAAQHELADALVDGLTAAALRHGDAAGAWLAPLAQVWLARAKPSVLTHKPLDSLLRALPTDARAACALALLDAPDADPSPLLALGRPWPAAVADAFLRSRLHTPEGARGWHGHLLGEAALAFPASHLGRKLPTPGEDANPYLRRSFDEFHAVLDLRRRLHELLGEEPT